MKKKIEKQKKCDACGKLFTGKHYKMYDENFNLQPGMVHCGCIFMMQKKVL